MAIPAYTSTAMYNFWLKFKKYEKTVKLGGTYAPKPGYHNTRNGLGRGFDYSRDEFAIDRAGSGNLASAIDLTLPDVQMKIYSARLMRSGKDKNDPRGNYLREFFGTLNGNTVTGWDFKKLSLTSSDSSHLWHIHISVLRGYAADARAYDALYSILVNEPLAKWKLRNGIKTAVANVVAKVTKKPAPKPAPVVTVSVKAGDSLTAIAARNHTTVAKLLSLNPAKKKNPDALNVGEKIRVK